MQEKFFLKKGISGKPVGFQGIVGVRKCFEKLPRSIRTVPSALRWFLTGKHNSNRHKAVSGLGLMKRVREASPVPKTKVLFVHKDVHVYFAVSSSGGFRCKLPWL